ncbi:MAG: tRNA (adenosine(37)-N6)-threonylcarbamoyltransferase complex dimerization subunit type 1 TsaB [Candidatus Sumerlaeia bacterium]|nr:tRNA (adenosine(37)-N6)-threonylcarbamoyltransferase complex dimerization subunit type 1 TsaB [Candidatus Sumerlaeia bacterium]
MNRSLILGLETCTPVGGVCLLNDEGNVLGSRVIDDPKAQSVQLAAAIRELLHTAKAGWEDVRVVGVSLGPGSFTGVRLGLSLAKGICASGTPNLIGVNTLEAMAFGVSDFKPGIYIPVLNARLGEVYAQVFEVEASGSCIPRTQPFCGKPQELCSYLLEDHQITIGKMFGHGVGDYEKVFREKLVSIELLKEEYQHPSAEWVGRLTKQTADSKNYQPRDAQEVMPLYLRNASVSTPKKTS